MGLDGGQQKLLRPVAFRPYLTIGLVFVEKYLSPNRTNDLSLGVGLAHFKDFIH
jgi:hypothetical protein